MTLDSLKRENHSYSSFLNFLNEQINVRIHVNCQQFKTIRFKSNVDIKHVYLFKVHSVAKTLCKHTNIQVCLATG